MYRVRRWKVGEVANRSFTPLSLHLLAGPCSSCSRRGHRQLHCSCGLSATFFLSATLPHGTTRLSLFTKLSYPYRPHDLPITTKAPSFASPRYDFISSRVEITVTMAQGLIKTKLGSSKGKAPNKDAKKGKRTIAPRRANLVKNATLIKVSPTTSFLSYPLTSFLH